MFTFIENWFLFHPATALRSWMGPPLGMRIEEVELAGLEGQRIHAWWTTPEGWQPEQGAVIYCHGNAGNLSHRGEGLRRWQDLLGMAVLIFDYPGYGRSAGRPSEAGCYAAADAAYDHLIAVRKLTTEYLLLYGGSLGGAVAIDLAWRRPHRALVLVSAFTSLRDMARKTFPFLPVHWAVSQRFDNLRKISACTSPVFLAHGTADRVVPFAQGERLFAAAREPKQFFPMQGHDHQHTPGPDWYAALKRFLARSAPLPANIPVTGK